MTTFKGTFVSFKEGKSYLRYFVISRVPSTFLKVFTNVGPYQ